MAEEPQEVVVTNAGQPIVVVVSPFASVFSYETPGQATAEFPTAKTVTIEPVRA